MLQKTYRLATLALGLCGVIHAQAVVNETQETATLWVDAANGSDSNPGTQLQPLQTIGAAATIALANNRASIGTHVTINPGTYRESLGGTEVSSLVQDGRGAARPASRGI